VHRADYVVKRLAFALMTVFVALTLNFILFRALPGTAVSDLSRVPHATPQFRAELARSPSLWRTTLVPGPDGGESFNIKKGAEPDLFVMSGFHISPASLGCLGSSVDDRGRRSG